MEEVDCKVIVNLARLIQILWREHLIFIMPGVIPPNKEPQLTTSKYAYQVSSCIFGPKKLENGDLLKVSVLPIPTFFNSNFIFGFEVLLKKYDYNSAHAAAAHDLQGAG